MALNKVQQIQLEKQLAEHKHDRYEVNINLSDNLTLNNFVVYKNVLRPEKMVALNLAKFIFINNGLANKIVIDIGCGSGIQGIVAGLSGAKKIILSDTSEYALANTKENIYKFNLQNKTVVLKSDLFQNIGIKADVIIFNHPFFPSKPLESNPISSAMLDEGLLLKRFLIEARKYLSPKGKIIMPYFHLAGETNNPIIQGPKYGYRVAVKSKLKSDQTLQKGEVSISELRDQLF
ncbi:MAG: Ribosomal protein L11 methyltransferase [Parcubacteria bacterium OLB19]|nr:MAG: Ribosomal protein L11 methyltransferase [Parcubacteria bacterium OLB19]